MRTKKNKIKNRKTNKYKIKGGSLSAKVPKNAWTNGVSNNGPSNENETKIKRLETAHKHITKKISILEKNIKKCCRMKIRVRRDRSESAGENLHVANIFNDYNIERPGIGNHISPRELSENRPLPDYPNPHVLYEKYENKM